MIKRVAMWKLKDVKYVHEMEAKLLSLMGNVPSLLDIEVGINISNSPSAYDIVFTGVFKNRNSLIEFEKDTFHKAVGDWVTEHRDIRHVVDYELKD